MERLLGSQVFAVEHGDDLVFLDLASNAYLVLTDARPRIRLGNDLATILVEDLEVEARLETADLLATEIRQPPKRRPPLSTPLRDLAGADAVRPTLGEILDMAWTAVEMIWLYRSRPLSHLVAAGSALGETLAPPTRPACEAMLRRARIFAQLLPWIPFQGQCLFRSAMLRRFLRRAGFDPAWVFGVRTWPFAAHCWLQVEDLVLDDRAEFIRALSPIMTV